MPAPTTCRLVHAARAGTRALTAEDLWRVPRVGAPAPTPDGRRAVVPVTTYDLAANEGTTRLWLVDLARDDAAAPRALTSPATTSTQPAVSPGGDRVAFLRKEGPKGRPQVFVMPLDGGEAERVCELPLGAFDVRWMPAGDALVVAAHLYRDAATPEATRAEDERREKDPVKVHVTEEPLFRYWDRWLTTGETPHLLHLDLATRTLRDLTPDASEWFSWMEPAGQFDIAPDGGEIAYSALHFDAERHRLRSRIHVVDVASGARRVVSPDDVHNAFRPRYARCGRSLVFGVTYEPDFYADRVRLMRHDRADAQNVPILADWEHSPAEWQTEDDGSVVFLADRAARTELFRIGADDEPQLLAGGGTLGGMRPLPRGGAVFTRQTLSHPTEVHVLEDGAVRRVTHFTDAALDGVALGAVHEMEFDGAAGARVQMFVVDPPHADGDGPPPLVHVVHGGPHGTSADSFHPRWNAHLFAAPGYVAALVNFQGSTSWGQDFAQRIQGTWGDRPYGDVVAATDVLVAEGRVDAGRMAIAGGSYGGYLAAWVTTQTDRFRCAINHAGVFDTQGMFASDVMQGRHVSLGGRPWQDTDGLDRWNPLRQAAGMRTPMLVVHGERDYRVPVTQGLLCYSILRDRGVPARLVYFPDENHWVLKPQNSLRWYREVHAWLARFLGAEGAAAGAEDSR